ETELKFIVPPSGLMKVKHARCLGKNSSPPPEVDVVSVYYDTPSRDLRESGITLRLRRQGNKWLQTVKADVDSFPRRQEWEREIDEDGLDFDAAEGTALEPLLSKKVRHNLKPLFETRVRRSIVNFEQSNSKIEIGLDRGRLTSGRLHSPISEL